jgi:hypothetical protein
MQTLTIEEVKAAARAAYDAGTLTAQHPDPTMRRCVYDVGDGYRCAIGCALSASTIDALVAADMNDAVGVIRLDDDGIIALDRRGDAENLQCAHDTWATYSAEFGEDSPTTIECRNKFLRMIDHPSVA